MPDGQEYPGELSFKEGEGAALRVFGSRQASLSEPTRWVQALHGTTLGGQDLSLLDAALFQHQDHLWGGDEMPTSQEWRSHTLIVGMHVDREDDLEFSTATLRVAGLEAWLAEQWGGPPFFSAPPRVPSGRSRRARRGRARITGRRKVWRRRPEMVQRTRVLSRLREYRPVGSIGGRVEEDRPAPPGRRRARRERRPRRSHRHQRGWPGADPVRRHAPMANTRRRRPRAPTSRLREPHPPALKARLSPGRSW
jgi:ApeA N-terminal domain 1